MTLQSPETGGLDENQIKESVLEHIRAERSVPSLSFAEDPARLMGGFDTLVYAFRLAGAPTDLAGPLVLRVFPGPGGVGQASKEAIFQNAVASSGFPVPKVIVAGGDKDDRRAGV